MTALISAVLSFLLLYKYIALFLVAYLAALAVPLPSNTSLLAATVFASQGYLNIYVVLLVAFAGNILGDITGFVVSRMYGEKLLMKIGLRKVMASKRYHDLKGFIVNHSKATIFITRFIGGACPLVNILTGLSKEVTFKKFIVYATLGEFTYVVGLGLSGYFFGGLWETFTVNIELLSVGVVFILIAVITKKIYF